MSSASSASLGEDDDDDLLRQLEEKRKAVEALQADMAALERRRGSKAEKRKKKLEKHKRTENDTEEYVAPSIERLSSFGRIRRESLPDADTEMNKHDIQLVEQVGQGSFGVVWRALHKPTSTQVAVKLFLSEDVETEINLLAKTRLHPHVLTFLGVILEQDDPYKEPQVALVTRFMSRGSLHEQLVTRCIDGDREAYSQFLIARLVGLAAQAAAGVAHLHREGIIHRDLACRNLLLDDFDPAVSSAFGRAAATSVEASISMDAEGGYDSMPRPILGRRPSDDIEDEQSLLRGSSSPARLGCVVAVADFGFARVRQKKQLQTSLENGSGESAQFSVNRIGPVRWEAPETLKYRKYSEKSDIFMFGVCLWEMASRSVPWAGLTSQAAAHAVLSGERLAVPLDVDPVMGSLMQRCWATDPKERPTMAEAREILKERHDQLVSAAAAAETGKLVVNSLVRGQLLHKIARTSHLFSLADDADNSGPLSASTSSINLEQSQDLLGLALSARRLHVSQDLRRLKWARLATTTSASPNLLPSSNVSTGTNSLSSSRSAFDAVPSRHLGPNPSPPPSLAVAAAISTKTTLNEVRGPSGFVAVSSSASSTLAAVNQGFGGEFGTRTVLLSDVKEIIDGVAPQAKPILSERGHCSQERGSSSGTSHRRRRSSLSAVLLAKMLKKRNLPRRTKERKDMPRTATAVERKMDKHEPLEGMHFRQKDSFDESDSDAAPSISDSDFGDESDGESTAQEYKNTGSSGGDNTVPAAGNNNNSSSNGSKGHYVKAVNANMPVGGSKGTPLSEAWARVSKQDVRLFCSLKNPSIAVKALAEALCLIFDELPISIMKESPTKDDYWNVAKKVGRFLRFLTVACLANPLLRHDHQRLLADPIAFFARQQVQFLQNGTDGAPTIFNSAIELGAVARLFEEGVLPRTEDEMRRLPACAIGLCSWVYALVVTFGITPNPSSLSSPVNTTASSSAALSSNWLDQRCFTLVTSDKRIGGGSGLVTLFCPSMDVRNLWSSGLRLLLSRLKRCTDVEIFCKSNVGPQTAAEAAACVLPRPPRPLMSSSLSKHCLESLPSFPSNIPSVLAASVSPYFQLDAYVVPLTLTLQQQQEICNLTPSPSSYSLSSLTAKGDIYNSSQTILRRMHEEMLGLEVLKVSQRAAIASLKVGAFFLKVPTGGEIVHVESMVQNSGYDAQSISMDRRSNHAVLASSTSSVTPTPSVSSASSHRSSKRFEAKHHERFFRLSGDYSELEWEGMGASDPLTGFSRPSVRKSIALVDVARLSHQPLSATPTPNADVNAMVTPPVAQLSFPDDADGGGSGGYSEWVERNTEDADDPLGAAGVSESENVASTAIPVQNHPRSVSLSRTLSRTMLLWKRGGGGGAEESTRQINQSDRDGLPAEEGASYLRHRPPERPRRRSSSSIVSSFRADLTLAQSNLAPRRAHPIQYSSGGNKFSIKLVGRDGLVLLHLIAPNQLQYDLWCFGLDALLQQVHARIAANAAAKQHTQRFRTTTPSEKKRDPASQSLSKPPLPPFPLEQQEQQRQRQKIRFSAEPMVLADTASNLAPTLLRAPGNPAQASSSYDKFLASAFEKSSAENAAP